VYASGYLEPKDFLRVGLPLWILSQVVLIVLVAVFWQFMGFGDLPGF
jgi:di/tricarboxylate transporter